MIFIIKIENVRELIYQNNGIPSILQLLQHETKAYPLQSNLVIMLGNLCTNNLTIQNYIYNNNGLSIIEERLSYLVKLITEIDEGMNNEEIIEIQNVIADSLHSISQIVDNEDISNNYIRQNNIYEYYTNLLSIPILPIKIHIIEVFATVCAFYSNRNYFRNMLDKLLDMYLFNDEELSTIVTELLFLLSENNCIYIIHYSLLTYRQYL